jgi:membrane protein DedA with SNARE-associated domain
MINISQFLEILQDYSERVPLEVFTFIGAFIEEIIAPIPSPFIMTLAGSIAQSQNSPILYLVVLAAIGSLGKTFGSYLLYLVSFKAEDIILRRFGKFFGIEQKNLESISKLVEGKHTWIIIFLLRAIPVIPTSPVSIVSGIIKLPLKTYLVSTFAGNVIRNGMYLYVGYEGTQVTQGLMQNLESSESLVKLLIIGAVVLVGSYFIYKFAANAVRKYLE